ncbi:MAG TPA: carbon monoxide dehydrogenase subunit G [Actinomycetales bacterium]|nr:carbon monoxide dehydrogenase subunit G [Actinomycetales bacterium]
MKVNGDAVLHAPPATVFSALNDPAVLARTIPGCQSLSPLGEDRYAMAVTAGVAAVKGTYEGEVRLTEQQPPHAFTLRAKGSGAPGTVDTTVRVTLAEVDGGTTRLEYDADAVVGGMVGGVGQRMLSGVARKMAGQFFAAVDGELTGALPAVAAGVPVPAPAGPLAQRPLPAPPGPWAPPDNRVPFYVVLAGVGAGAFWALVGVLVGWRIARSGRGSRR